MKTKILLVSVFFALFSCEKVELSEKGGENQEPSFDFEVPTGFAWDVHKSIEVSVKISDQYNGLLNYGIEIYNDEKLLDKGFVKGTEEYSTFVVVEKISTDLTVVQIDPNGEKAVRTVSLNASSIDVDFATVRKIPAEKSALTRSNGISVLENAVDMKVPSDAIVVTNGMTTLESGKTYVVRGSVHNIRKARDITLYIDGPYNGGGEFRIKDIDLSNSTIHILSGGRLVGVTTKEHTNLSIINHPGGEINIYGDIVISDGSFINHSEVFLYNLTLTDSKLETNGLLLVGVRQPINDKPGHVDHTGVDFETKTGMIILKNTNVTVGKHLRAKNFKSENGEISFKNEAWIQVMDDMACIGTQISTVDNVSSGAVVLANKMSISKKNDVVGNMILDVKYEILLLDDGLWKKYVDNNNVGMISIPSINHNILAYVDGGYKAKDPDDLPQPTEIQYFDPRYTILMEDSYPGDMDMNDIVCEWQLGTLKDVHNQVTKFGLRYTIVALGGLNKLAGAVALRGIDKSNIKSIRLNKKHSFSKYFTLDGVGLESGNSDAVIPLFEDAHKTFFGMWNTKIVNTFDLTEDYYSFDVEVELHTPIAVEKISRENMDFFIVVSGDSYKRKEIHLFGNSLTEKASNEQFDFTEVGFVSGVELVGGFLYPKELTSIKDAYPKFELWVTSGGSSNEEWYKYPVDDKVIQRRSSK